MEIERVKGTVVQERNGNCQGCGYFTSLTITRAATGEMFLGKKVYDDVWRCDLCQETEGITGDKLIRYIGNMILHINVERGRIDAKR